MPDRPVMGCNRPVLSKALDGGQLRRVLIHPDPALREVTLPAGYMTGPALADLARDMLATMYECCGRGLAAPQIGVLRSMFVMDAGWKDGAPDPLVMLDPEIVERSDDLVACEERCLSIPGQPVEVMRPSAITLAWYDLDGRRRSRAMTGAAARIAQHEADHLKGRLIVDFL